MGRRNRSKRNSSEEEGLERTEIEWLIHRHTSKRQKMEDNKAPSPVDGESKNTDHSMASQKNSNDDVNSQSKSPRKGVDADEDSPKSDRIEKMKLKKQRQKERQRQKKARHASKRQKKMEDNEASLIDGGESNNTDKSTPPQNNSNGDDNSQSKSPRKGVDEGSPNPNKDKIEKMKLKKQRQKERRMQKKAQAAAVADAKEKNRRESEKALQKRQKEDRERKAKMRESQSQQQFKALAKGVQYQDLIVGKGPTVRDRKKVRVSYTLRSKSHTSGKILDASNNFGFRIGKGEVIKGWDIGLQDMRVGGVRRLVVPPSAGYGNNKDVGAGRGADLYFQIELLNVAP